MASNNNSEMSFSMVTIVAIGLIGYLLYQALSGLGSGIGATAQSVVDYVNGQIAQGASTAANQTVLTGTGTFPDWIVIPGTGGSTAYDLYSFGFTTDQIKQMMAAYQQNFQETFISADGASITVPQ